MGRDLEVCLSESGSRTFPQTGDAHSCLHSGLCRLPRNCWRPAAALRPSDPFDRSSIHRRDDSGDSLDKSRAISWDIPVASATGSAQGGDVGGVARSTVRIRANHDRTFSAGERPRQMVAGCVVTEQAAYRPQASSSRIPRGLGLVSARLGPCLGTITYRKCTWRAAAHVFRTLNNRLYASGAKLEVRLPGFAGTVANCEA
jgi:hypothetical protein